MNLEDSIVECAQNGGPIAYSFFRSVSLPCFVDTDPDFGLEQARHLLSFMNKVSVLTAFHIFTFRELPE